jgi:hypothetical protein
MIKQLTKESDYQVESGTNILCSKLGGKGCNILATGDDQNNVILWRLTIPKPKFTFGGLKSNPTVLTFNESATKLFAGTVGGTVHSWDLA